MIPRSEELGFSEELEMGGETLVQGTPQEHCAVASDLTLSSSPAIQVQGS